MSDSNCILYIEHGEIIGGSNVSLKEVIIDALQNGYRCHVICVNKLLADVFTEIGATTYVCTLAPLYHNTAYYYKFTVLDFLRFAKVLAKTVISFAQLLKIVRQVGPDFVHLNSSTLILYSVYFRVLGIATLIHVRENIVKGFFGIRRKIIQQLADRLVTFIIYISEFEFELLKTKPEKSFVIYNYVHAEAFKEKGKPLTYREAFGMEKPAFTLITLGGLFSLKGGKTILESMAYLDSGFELLVVGSRDPRIYPDELERIDGTDYLNAVLDLLKDDSISNSVKFIGKVKNPADYVRLSDGLIFWAARPHFPRTVFEAWMLKKPVLYYNPDFKNRIINSGNVIMINDDSASELGNSIKLMRTGLQGKAESIQNAYESAMNNFTEKNFIKINALYQLLKSRHPLETSENK